MEERIDPCSQPTAGHGKSYMTCRVVLHGAACSANSPACLGPSRHLSGKLTDDFLQLLLDQRGQGSELFLVTRSQRDIETVDQGQLSHSGGQAGDMYLPLVLGGQKRQSDYASQGEVA